jgi:site-specific recombinase XerC
MMMPKKTPFPRLRVHIRRGAHGQVWTNYYYDGRPDGEKDTPLGNDYAAAVVHWRQLHEHKPRIAGTLEEAFSRWAVEVLPTYESAETRKGYGRSLKIITPVFGPATWDQVTPKTITGYLKTRSAKTQGNREMALLSVIWAWAVREELVKTKFPLLGIRGWKNKEQARVSEVTDALFATLYTHACPLVRDAMDLASATGLRLTDCRTVQIPPGDVLRVRSSKTGKAAEFCVTDSPVLSRLVSARTRVSAPHLLLLTTSTGKKVSARMLRDRWDEAREKAALAHPELADELRAMYLRDLRKRAADLAGSDQEASELLQHSSVALTKKHYRTRATKLRPVR